MPDDRHESGSRQTRGCLRRIGEVLAAPEMAHCAKHIYVAVERNAPGCINRPRPGRRDNKVAHRNGNVVDHCRAILVPQDAIEHVCANVI